MPTFHVTDLWEIPERNLVVLAGAVVEGEIRAGMFLRVPFNHEIGFAAQIASIEASSPLCTNSVCICIEARPNELKLWRGLNIGDEVLEVYESL